MRGKKRSDYMKEHYLEGLCTADKISMAKKKLKKVFDIVIPAKVRCKSVA